MSLLSRVKKLENQIEQRNFEHKTPKGYCVKRDASGNKILCFRVRQNGKSREIQLTENELKREFLAV